MNSHLLALSVALAPSSALLTSPAVAQGGYYAPCIEFFEAIPGAPGSTIGLSRVCDGIVSRHYLRSLGQSESGASADLNGDLRTDVLSVVGGRPVVCNAPGVIGHSTALTVAASTGYAYSSTIVPGGSGVSGQAIVSTDDGLQTWDQTGSPNSWAPIAIGNSTDWSKAATLRVGDLNGDGTPELIGLFLTGPTSAKVRVATLLPGNTLGAKSGRSFSTTEPGIEIFDYSALEPGQEIGITVGNRLFVFDGTLGSLIGSELFYGDVQHCATFTDAQGEALAVISSYAGTDQLTVVRGSGAEAPLALGLNSSAIAAVRPGLAEGGSLALLAGNGVTILDNDGGGQAPTFSGSRFDLNSELSVATSGHEAVQSWLVVDDFDRDGDVDVLLHSDVLEQEEELIYVNEVPFPVHSARFIVAMNDASILESTRSVKLMQESGFYTIPGLVVTRPLDSAMGTNIPVVPTFFNLGVGANSPLTHLEFTTYQDGMGEVGDPVLPVLLPAGLGDSFTTTIDIPFLNEVGDVTKNVVYVRQVGYDSVTGAVSHAGPDVRIRFAITVVENTTGAGDPTKDGAVGTEIARRPPLPPYTPPTPPVPPAGGN